jgi:flagellar motility protein MotE (MotC chaperone)
MIKLRLPQGTGILHAAALGAVALLLLKMLGLMTDTAPAPQIAPPAAPAASLSAGISQTIVRARGPGVFDPETTGSVKEPAKPDAPKPNAAKPDAAKPDAAKPDAAKPDAAKPDAAKPDAAKPEPGKPAARATAAKPPSGAPSPAGRDRASVLDGAALPSGAERALLERLGERREELDGRARELEMRERLLNSAEKKLEGRIEELRTLEEKGGDPAQKAQQNEQAALKNVVIMYEAMKPKDAARVFDRLPHEVLVPVVLQMNPRKMAEVLAAMSPESAEKLTIALATRGRTAEARTPAAGVMPANELQAMEPTPVPRR